MSALAQLRIDTLFAVLVGTACAMMSLRAWLAVSKRALEKRDKAVIAEIESREPSSR
jgi:hypothetical protein